MFRGLYLEVGSSLVIIHLLVLQVFILIINIDVRSLFFDTVTQLFLFLQHCSNLYLGSVICLRLEFRRSKRLFGGLELIVFGRGKVSQTKELVPFFKYLI